MTTKTAAPKGPACHHLTTCPMFKVFSSESTGRIFREFYCEGKLTDCARYQKSEKGEAVSDFLLPNGVSINGK